MLINVPGPNNSLNFYPFPLLGILINYFFFQWRSDLEEESSHPPAQALSLVHQVELVHKLKQNKNIQTNLTRHSEWLAPQDLNQSVMTHTLKIR